ncbi:MAG TPA: hypothetical protein DIS79_07245 [Bacteroidetes bacterium]|nr:hypothetical protein [Bacteroidota bacterium]HRK05645.1 hypothetical protein [Chlorobiota bacterium]
MTLIRTIAGLLLATFIVVIGASALHVHDGHEEAGTHVEAMSTDGHGHTSEDSPESCDLCKVIKDRVAVVPTLDLLFVGRTQILELPPPTLVRVARIPLETSGLAPPRA